jgi:hypothetical protein
MDQIRISFQQKTNDNLFPFQNPTQNKDYPNSFQYYQEQSPLFKSSLVPNNPYEQFQNSTLNQSHQINHKKSLVN